MKIKKWPLMTTTQRKAFFKLADVVLRELLECAKGPSNIATTSSVTNVVDIQHARMSLVSIESSWFKNGKKKRTK